MTNMFKSIDSKAHNTHYSSPKFKMSPFQKDLSAVYTSSNPQEDRAANTLQNSRSYKDIKVFVPLKSKPHNHRYDLNKSPRPMTQLKARKFAAKSVKRSYRTLKSVRSSHSNNLTINRPTPHGGELPAYNLEQLRSIDPAKKMKESSTSNPLLKNTNRTSFDVTNDPSEENKFRDTIQEENEAKKSKMPSFMKIYDPYSHFTKSRSIVELS